MFVIYKLLTIRFEITLIRTKVLTLNMGGGGVKGILDSIWLVQKL